MGDNHSWIKTTWCTLATELVKFETQKCFKLMLSNVVCVCVLVHASWYVRDRDTNRAGHCLCLARSVLPQDNASRTMQWIHFFPRVPAPTYVFPPSCPGYPIQNIEVATLWFRGLIFFVRSLVTSTWVSASCFLRGTSHITQVGILLGSYLWPDSETDLRQDPVKTTFHMWTDGLSKDNHPTTLATY